MRVAQVLQAMGIHFAPAGGIGQGAVADKVRRDLWRDDVQQVEGFLFDAHIAFGVLDLEPGLARGAVDLDQVGVERQLCGVLFNVLHQRRDEGGHAKQGGTGQVEFDLDVFQVTLPEPVIA